jgi:hypothetical protein
MEAGVKAPTSRWASSSRKRHNTYKGPVVLVPAHRSSAWSPPDAAPSPRRFASPQKNSAPTDPGKYTVKYVGIAGQNGEMGVYSRQMRMPKHGEHLLRSEQTQVLPESMQCLQAGVKFDQEHPAVRMRHMKQALQADMMTQSGQGVSEKQVDTVCPQQHDRWIPQASVQGRGLVGTEGGRRRPAACAAGGLEQEDSLDGGISLQGSSTVLTQRSAEPGAYPVRPLQHQQPQVVHAGLLGWKLTNQIALESEAYQLDIDSMDDGPDVTSHEEIPRWEARSKKAAIDSVRRQQERLPMWAKRVEYDSQDNAPDATAVRASFRPTASSSSSSSSRSPRAVLRGKHAVRSNQEGSPPPQTEARARTKAHQELYLEYLQEKTAWM